MSKKCEKQISLRDILYRRDYPTIRYANYNVDHTYNVFRQDFCTFARLVDATIRPVDLAETCAIVFARIYVAQHGLRMAKGLAGDLLRRIVRIDHPALNVLQIHRADVLQCCDNDDNIVVVRLSGGIMEYKSLAALYHRAIYLARDSSNDGKLMRYRTGFLADYSYFASPSLEEHVVTYAQAYNSAAKMAPTADSGFQSAYLVAGGYTAAAAAGHGGVTTTTKLGEYEISRTRQGST